ncbi:putative pentatricopeptide repeat-containing protein At1g69350, mitochondrial isoform X1 [Cucurbita maxima]|uniref:Pentatricopeptide repeat-containing protein At1g69350, mitochondrial isoform X1 n=1 Tax=Cucurbita maxima TaxID=3661 RepID=A0A6J1K8I6_CUCMA|nr:putative pentatricopeptide repeat-containing protein At1g69350, mitochondrial isoform X1 [Cucurbita maxima]
MGLYMPLFKCSTTLRTLTQLHAHLLVTALHKDALASTKLIESYSQMGDLQASKSIFRTFHSPDSFMWGMLLKSHVWSGSYEGAINLYHQMFCQQIQFNAYTFPSVLRACSGFGDLSVGERVHGRVIKSGFDMDPVVETSLLSMYGELGYLDSACKVFDEMPLRDLVSWSSIISCNVGNGKIIEGLDTFRCMVSEGVAPDSVLILTVAEACGELEVLRLAKSVHGYILRMGIESDRSFDSSLIFMYAKCGSLHSAEILFENVTHHCTSTWTAMISSYNQGGYFQEALAVFASMRNTDVEPNSVTMMVILRSCTNLGLLREGKSVHCVVIKNELDTNLDCLGPTLLELYAGAAKHDHCEKILHEVGGRGIVVWNTLISVYAQKGLLKEALVLFVRMQKQGLMPDSFSLASSLSASGNEGMFQLGLQIHGHVIKRPFMDEYVLNALIDMYSKCGFVDLAYMIFDKMEPKGVVTWNSMICGLSQNGYSTKAISLFDLMYLTCLEIGDVAFVGVIQACTHLGFLEKGKWIHHKVITFGVRKDLYIETALVDMYAKCGDLQTARRVFDNMSERSLVSWSTLLSSYGVHGQISEVIFLFSKMLESGIKPNDVIVMNVLSACSHAGCVKEGMLFFSSVRDFGIEPKIEHFACIVDLLSRAGDLDGAYKIIKSMPFPAGASIWGSLLNGCRIHQRLDIAKNIRSELLNIQTDDTGYYTLLSNIYAEGGEWNEFRKVRSMMKCTGLKKVPAYSVLQLGKKAYRFGAGDASHSQTKDTHRYIDNFQRFSQEEVNNVQPHCSLHDTSSYSEYNYSSSYSIV